MWEPERAALLRQNCYWIKKIETVLYDGNKDLDVEKLYEKAPKLKGMPVLLGELTDEQLRAFDVAVLSPGVPTDLPVVERMRAQNVCIWGEIELAYSFAKGRLIAITGTNGKTTTTALTGEIMKIISRMCAWLEISEFRILPRLPQ